MYAVSIYVALRRDASRFMCERKTLSQTHFLSEIKSETINWKDFISPKILQFNVSVIGIKQLLKKREENKFVVYEHIKIAKDADISVISCPKTYIAAWAVRVWPWAPRP